MQQQNDPTANAPSGNVPTGTEGDVSTAAAAGTPAVDPWQDEPGGQDLLGLVTEGIGKAGPWGAGAAASLVRGWPVYAWWRRRQESRRPVARLRRALSSAGVEIDKDFPKTVGQAAAKSRSPWLPFALVPVALWLRSQGGDGKRASDQILQPLKLDKRSKQLARQSADRLEKRGRHAIRQAAPVKESGWGWRPVLLMVPAAGGVYLAYKKLIASDDSYTDTTAA